jgi:hypothetical protein
MPGAVLATPLSAQHSRATCERCASRQRRPRGAPHHVVPLRRGWAEALEILENAMRQVSRAEKRASAAPGRLICMRGASLDGRGVAARHDVPHARIHPLLGVTRNAARRILRAGVLPAFHDRDHRWLLAVPCLESTAGRKRRGPAKPAPQSIPSPLVRRLVAWVAPSAVLRASAEIVGRRASPTRHLTPKTWAKHRGRKRPRSGRSTWRTRRERDARARKTASRGASSRGVGGNTVAARRRS